MHDPKQSRLQRVFAPRPIWMNALMVFCAYMTFIYLPFDMFVKPVAEDEEVWFGIVLHGWAAKATEPLHWAIYAAGTYGFYRMKPWMWPWASLYVAQVAVGMFVWSITDVRGDGLYIGMIGGLAFAALAVALWRARARFADEELHAGAAT